MSAILPSRASASPLNTWRGHKPNQHPITYPS